MPEVNIADGDVVTGADFDSIDDQLIITCTSSTRPTGVEGRHIFETDTNKRYVYDGSAWNLDGGFGWVSFTPSWTNLTPGNGTYSGCEYRYVDGGMWVKGGLTFGTTTSISGAVSLTLPNSESMRTISDLSSLGWATFTDSGSGYIFGNVRRNANTTVELAAFNSSSTYVAYNALSSTVPFTWTTNDVIAWMFFAPL